MRNNRMPSLPAVTILLGSILGVEAAGQSPIVANSVNAWTTPTSGMQQPVNGWRYLAFERGQPHVPSSYREMEPDSANGWWQCDIESNCRIYKDGNSRIRSRTTPQFEAVREWTAPTTGIATVTLNDDIWTSDPVPPNGGSNGDGSFLEVWRNGYRVEQLHVPPGQSPTPASAISATFAVNQGDILYFHVNAGSVPWDDTPSFNPIVTLTPNTTGHPTQSIVHNTATDFDTGLFEYLFYHHVTQQYTPLVYDPSHPNGPSYVHPNGYFCRIFAAMQHPLTNMDCVTRWTATEDGLLRLHGPSVVKLYQGNPVSVKIRLQSGSGSPEDVEDIGPITFVGRHCDQLLHVRAGDQVYLHVINEHTSNSGLYTSIAFDFELCPDGKAPSNVSITPGTAPHQIVGDEYYFDSYIKLERDLSIPSTARLEMRNCVLQFENAEERDHEAVTEGELAMFHTTIGGNRLTTGLVLHSNFRFLGSARWLSRDSNVRYTYGQLASASTTLDFDGHRAFPHGDLISVQDSMVADLRHTTGNLAITLPLADLANTPSTPVQLPLPIRSPSSTSTHLGLVTTSGNSWSLDYANHYCDFWVARLTGISNSTSPVYIDATNSGSLSVRISNAQSVSGTISVPQTWSSQTSFSVFNTAWTVGASTTISGWTADFHGTSDVRLLGPIRSAELMGFDSSRVALIGTPGTFDAQSNATTIRASGSGTRMVLDNVSLGTSWTRGEIKAESGARITARDVDLPYDLRLIAETGAKIIVSTAGIPQSNPSLSSAGNVHIVHDHWSFDDNTGEWRNWDPTNGFAPSTWSLVAGPETNNRVLHLDYIDPALLSGPHYARIVTPRVGTPLYAGTDVYLYLRARVHRQNSSTVPLEFSARQNNNWATWGALNRRMPIVADDAWHSYCWNIGNPTNNVQPGTTTPLSSFTSHGSATSFSPGIDYFGLRFGLDTDIFTAGDFVEIDFITVSPNYSAELLN